jgi:hypothetical protein
VLAEESWWRGKARSELPTRSRRRRRTVVVGEGAPVEIRGWLMSRGGAGRLGVSCPQGAGGGGGRWSSVRVPRLKFGKAYEGASGGNGWPMVAAHGDQALPE